ncbi:ABC-type transport auxiliary lipoprotein family protein [Stutzerimonas stutzeri]|uniref:ABC-type transport auxiliary lipoprotein family protein n=1 Tax=Stutzerimonas stutzeri TaxID=316 RepID=UPI002108E995|nr:ABC-type transport auxiliary lipoprotein family protein [Stutzerimonas stutzeri]MCQ4319468.1 ABC-type transport auxiliary lipoprotein family protein [Stutzerimonas stutzeri]
MSRLAPIRQLALSALLGTLSACTLLPDAEPIRVFLLPTAEAPANQTAGPLQQALRIHTPHASRILAGPRIAVVPDGNRISSYQGARWGDAAPTLLRDRLIEQFRQSGPVAVSSEDSNLFAELELFSDLRAFQSVYVDGQPQVLVRLDAQLASAGDQRILASRRFEIRQPSASPQLESVVAAFGRASDELSRQLQRWTIDAAKSQSAQ